MKIYNRARELDFDRTMAAGFARAPESLFALIAYNGELGAIRAKVSDPVTFEIRLLWWKEAIEDLARGKIRKHPVLDGLEAGLQAGRLDAKLLVGMAENRFSEFTGAAGGFEDFVKGRGDFLRPFYQNTLQALQTREAAENFNAFLAFDILGCLQNREFYKAREITPFKGSVDPGQIENLLRPSAGHPYFRGLAALGRWHFKHQKKRQFKPGPVTNPAQHPGKILKLWAAKWR